VAQSFNSLAALYFTQGKYAEAKPLFNSLRVRRDPGRILDDNESHAYEWGRESGIWTVEAGLPLEFQGGFLRNSGTEREAERRPLVYQAARNPVHRVIMLPPPAVLDRSARAWSHEPPAHSRVRRDLCYSYNPKTKGRRSDLVGNDGL
jgi:hypothetical protein